MEVIRSEELECKTEKLMIFNYSSFGINVTFQRHANNIINKAMKGEERTLTLSGKNSLYATTNG